MKTTKLRFTILAATTFLAACQSQPQSTAQPSPTTVPVVVSTTTTPAAANPSFDKWLGQWNGPEGTFLVLARNGEKYDIKIQSLDGPNNYEGVAVGNAIQFTRAGKLETIHAGNGQETGMKWLLDKNDCLIVKEGEGFCRK